MEEGNINLTGGNSMNPYEKNTVKTTVQREDKTFQSWDALEGFSAEKLQDNGQALLFFDHKVVWAKWDGKTFQFKKDESAVDVSNLQMMRLFNKKQELFIRRTESDKWLCRMRSDGEGKKTNVIDAHQYLLGTSQSEDVFSELWESSGTAKEVPLSIGEGKRAFIKTRNYIGFAGGLLANFEDSRILSIEEAS